MTGTLTRFVVRMREPTVPLVIVTITAATITFAPVLTSPLGPVDDHEYLKYLLQNSQRDPVVALSNGLERAWTDFRYEGRVRPLYHLGRTLSTAIFGDSSAIRYAFRIAIASAFLTQIAVVCAIRTSRIHKSHFLFFVTGLTAGLVATLYMPWLDIVGRLGPPDAIGLFGLVMIGFGVRDPLVGRPFTSSKTSSIFIVTGFLVMGGSRENYSMYASLIGLYFILYARQTNIQLRPFPRALLFAFMAFPITSMVSLQLRGGTDFYGNDRTLWTTLRDIASFVNNPLLTRLLPLLLLYVLLARKRRRVWRLYQSLLVVGLLLVDWLSFGESIQTYGRYRFMSDLLFLLFLSVVVIQLVAVAKPRSLNGRVIFSILIVSSWIPIFVGLESKNEEFDYVRRLNLGWSFLVAELASEAMYRDVSQIVIFTDSSGDAFSQHDLRERGVALRWFLEFTSHRPAEEPAYFVVQRDLASPGARVEHSLRTSLCIFAGVNPDIYDYDFSECSLSRRIY